MCNNERWNPRAAVGRRRAISTCLWSIPRLASFRSLLFTLILGPALSCQLQALSFEKISVGLSTIRQDRIRARLQFLASSHFKGRATGSPEAQLTAAYIASVFERNGLRSVPDSQGFIHSFQITQGLPQLGSVLELRPLQGPVSSFKAGKDFLPASWGPDGPAVEREAVFVGYGVTALDLDYDDYRGVDVQDKIVIMLGGVPKGKAFGRIGQTDYGDCLRKSLWAAAQGAAGALIILAPGENLASEKTDFREARSHLTDRVQSLKIPVVTATFAAGQQMIGLAPKPAGKRQTLSEVIELIGKELRPQSFPLEGRIRLQVSYRRRYLEGYNVVGLIPGSDPDLKDEFIVLGAHHDHVGVGDKGNIFFGADDNASGTTALLELSEAFQSNSSKPKRSLILAAWGAEEIGLLGSQHYVQRPPVPLKKTVAMVQMDMIGRNAQHRADAVNHLSRQQEKDNQNSLNILGTSFSPLLRTVIERSNTRTNLDLNFPPDLEAIDLIRRSDHWSFLKNGIPAVFLFTGFHPDYHRSTDTADKINFSKMERILKLVYLMVWELGEASQQPQMETDIVEKITYQGPVRD